jgi:L-fuculose-phosphate aldolase
VTGRHAPSSEIEVHACICRERADAYAVVHRHPSTATGFGVAGPNLMDGVRPEIIFLLGGVPLVPSVHVGTPALAEALVPYVPAPASDAGDG